MGKMRWLEAKYSEGKSWLPCKQCGQDFPTVRLDAQFCGANCRKANQRKRETAENTGIRLAQAIAEYAKQLDNPDLKEIVGRNLISIAIALNVTLAGVTDNSDRQ